MTFETLACRFGTDLELLTALRTFRNQRHDAPALERNRVSKTDSCPSQLRGHTAVQIGEPGLLPPFGTGDRDLLDSSLIA
jgi:hypothetical protein